ncbi:MAG TPA: peptidoglycan DD-metalloendopeptidase family protein [Patescibacteria group bacterium]|nr:peptidoglycan DD-metalloendopeptidase family protein [Patescibacteria group bacterium]
MARIENSSEEQIGSGFEELLTGLFTQSELMILDFNQIPPGTPDYKNIRAFFERCQTSGVNPRLPENRQQFNNNFLEKSGKRYLISRYAEDRHEMLKGSQIAEEGRTLHLGIDIFSKDLEPVYAPYDGTIVSVGREDGPHSFGHYIILKPDKSITDHYLFLGHLSKNLPNLGTTSGGERIATLGNWIDDENGGWSRHVHVQLLSELPKPDELPIGYSTKDNLSQNMLKYPDPSLLVFR